MIRNTAAERYQRAKQRLNSIHKYGQLPRVKYDIDENDEVTGISAISIVDKPAIESDFIAFGKVGTPRERYKRAKARMDKILQQR